MLLGLICTREPELGQIALDLEHDPLASHIFISRGFTERDPIPRAGNGTICLLGSVGSGRVILERRGSVRCELHVFTRIAAGHGAGQIARELGISRKAVETHCEHIKLKLHFENAEALRHGAQQLLG